jgi:hypothetical protein
MKTRLISVCPHHITLAFPIKYTLNYTDVFGEDKEDNAGYQGVQLWDVSLCVTKNGNNKNYRKEAAPQASTASLHVISNHVDLNITYNLASVCEKTGYGIPVEVCIHGSGELYNH